MPKIFEIDGFKFFFFSNEGDPLEPCHIHIRKAEFTAKFWLIPKVVLANSYGLNSKDLKKLEKIVLEKKELIVEKWNEYFNN